MKKRALINSLVPLFLFLTLSSCSLQRKVNKHNTIITENKNTEKTVDEVIKRKVNETIEFADDDFSYEIGLELDSSGNVSVGRLSEINEIDGLDANISIVDNKIIVTGKLVRESVDVIVDETIERSTTEQTDLQSSREDSEKIKESKTSWTGLYITIGISVFIILAFLFLYVKTRKIL